MAHTGVHMTPEEAALDKLREALAGFARTFAEGTEAGDALRVYIMADADAAARLRDRWVAAWRRFGAERALTLDEKGERLLLAIWTTEAGGHLLPLNAVRVWRGEAIREARRTLRQERPLGLRPGRTVDLPDNLEAPPPALDPDLGPALWALVDSLRPHEQAAINARLDDPDAPWEALAPLLGARSSAQARQWHTRGLRRLRQALGA